MFSPNINQAVVWKIVPFNFKKTMYDSVMELFSLVPVMGRECPMCLVSSLMKRCVESPLGVKAEQVGRHTVGGCGSSCGPL